MDEKKNKRGRKISFLLGVATAIIAIGVVYFLSMILPIGGTPNKPDSLQALRKAKEIQKIITWNYLGDYDTQKETDYMYLGMVAGLEDKYSTYYTKEEYESLQLAQQGVYLGIGISIAQRAEDGALMVVGVVSGSPAEEAGMKANDILISINGEDLDGKTSTEASELIQKSESDVLTIRIHRESTNENIELEVVRTELEKTSVVAGSIDDTIGYIQIVDFTGVTSDQFADAYKTLKDMGVKSLILDLRGNTGGLVDACCDVAKQILPEGLIVYTEDKNGNRKERTCDGETPISIPLAVLVDQKTASAAEILAGAIQDYGVGTIIGTNTYGKGIVQDTFKLNDGSALKITVSHYYTPKGHDIHGIGITPDVIVEADENSEKDLQLEKAKDILKGNKK